ncbi:hypothetical protein AYO42_06570 [Rhizomicrobium sp. SCGC AG-212-E05]|nr:hypothetical protein AYO42_06570 [Rhizomicrobium sp. SCGC AG-212-E05]
MPMGRFLTLALCAPILAWVATVFLIYQGWVVFSLKHGVTEAESLRIMFASAATIMVAGGMLGFFRAGWVGSVSLLLLAAGVSAIFAWIDVSILFPFAGWLGAVPAIILFAVAEKRKERQSAPEQPLPQP